WNINLFSYFFEIAESHESRTAFLSSFLFFNKLENVVDKS
ncbi:hypothetical protein ECPA24_0282, partial [Escherichia coli PA24]